MKDWLLPFLLIILVLATVAYELLRERADKVYLLTSGQVDMCLSCHQEQPDKAHGAGVVGCAECHLGNPLASEKWRAHQGMVKNPGELAWAEKTCGRQGCHPQDVPNLKKALMATNRGIIATLRYYWGETDDPNEDLTVEKLLQSDQNSLALDYFRKLCGTCHLWMKRGELPSFLAEKGGGCTACHNEKPKTPPKKGEKPHPQIIRKVSLEACVRCHNRSGRIGLTYQGMIEAEGYGVPYDEGLPRADLVDGRSVIRIPPDVHFQAGMVCIDCHLREEIMGDGNYYAHFEEQVEISCEMCHGGEGLSRKGRKAKNVEKDHQGRLVLRGKLDGKLHPLDPPKEVCLSKEHRRLTCQACHSHYVPQCFGCHVRRDLSETQLDKIAVKETRGLWEEFRSYMRYREPTLGVHGEKIKILVPG
ncbi:hypothetical protein [Thermosulfuriphilus sp.]